MKSTLVKLLAGIVIGGLVFSGIYFTGENKLKEMTNDAQVLVEDKEKLGETITNLQDTLKNTFLGAKADLQILEGTKAELENRLAAETVGHSNDNKGNQQVIAKLNQELKEIKGSIDVKNNQIADLEKQLADMTANHDRAVNRANQLAGQVNANAKMLKEAQEQLAELNANGRTEDTDRIATLSNTISELNGEINILQSKINEGQNNKVSAQAEVDRLEAEVKKANDLVDQAYRTFKEYLASPRNINVPKVQAEAQEFIDNYTWNNNR